MTGSAEFMDIAAATRLSKKLAAAGFLGLGGFHPEDADAVPDLRPQVPARTLLLIGSAGSDLWRQFTQSSEYADKRPDPLDRYTRRCLGAMAAEFGLTAVFPFDGPPFYPFQRWALRAGGFSQSPLGVLANEAYGPWVGLRAAFLSRELFGTFEAAGSVGPCESCEDKPCVTACPVNAISLKDGYDVPACREHLMTDLNAECRSGCLARRACPFGTLDAQPSEQAQFHMSQFLGMSA